MYCEVNKTRDDGVNESRRLGVRCINLGASMAYFLPYLGKVFLRKESRCYLECKAGWTTLTNTRREKGAWLVVTPQKNIVFDPQKFLVAPGPLCIPVYHLCSSNVA